MRDPNRDPTGMHAYERMLVYPSNEADLRAAVESFPLSELPYKERVGLQIPQRLGLIWYV